MAKLLPVKRINKTDRKVKHGSRNTLDRDFLPQIIANKLTVQKGAPKAKSPPLEEQIEVPEEQNNTEPDDETKIYMEKQPKTTSINEDSLIIQVNNS